MEKQAEWELFFGWSDHVNLTLLKKIEAEGLKIWWINFIYKIIHELVYEKFLPFFISLPNIPLVVEILIL